MVYFLGITIENSGSSPIRKHKKMKQLRIEPTPLEGCRSRQSKHVINYA